MRAKGAFYQDYRSKLITIFEKVYNKSYELGALGFYLSGAGPTIMVIIDKNDERFSNNFKKIFKRRKFTMGYIIIIFR